jgi:hypothetical protein
MAEYVFVNPSFNARLVAKFLRANGRDAVCLYSKDYFELQPKAVWAFFADSFVRLGNKELIQNVINEILVLKKPFFPKFASRSLKRCLKETHEALFTGSVQDYLLFNASFRQYSKTEIEKSAYTAEELIGQHSANSIVITDFYPSPTGKFSLSRWRTDCDAAQTFGKDYYFFFDGGKRHELYCNGNEIVCVSDVKNKLDWLKEIVPTFSRFAFEKVDNITFCKNTNSFLQKMFAKVFLINDYSWSGICAELPNSWVSACGRFLLFTDKKH